MAFFSTIFVIFLSMMTLKYLSTGSNTDNETEISEKPIITATPDPYEDDIVPNDNMPAEEEMLLTNNQKYFEPLVNPGGINILLLASEPTGFNFDTIMILNIDNTEKKMKIISLPRDIYIDYSDEVMEAVREKKPSYPKEKGFYRINAAPGIGNIIEYEKGTGRFNKSYVDFISDLIQEVFSIHINDYAYVRVNGFRRIVDHFGGVTVYVPVFMNYSDPSQDFEVYLEKGTQHLNGAQAEGFVRFRQGYDEEGAFHNYGDIFRKENQNRFIKAFIDQHVTIKNLGKLSGIAEIISNNLVTSIKGWDNIVEYGALAETALTGKYPIESVELEMKDKTIKGSSYIILKTEE